jgi:hypothetical protein
LSMRCLMELTFQVAILMEVEGLGAERGGARMPQFGAAAKVKRGLIPSPDLT